MIKRIKERMSMLKRDIRFTYMRLLAGDFSCVTKADRASNIAAAVAGTMYAISSPSFALKPKAKAGSTTGDDSGGTGVIDNFGSMAEKLKNSLGGQLTKFAGLALGVCVIWFLICTNEEDAKRPLKWGKRIIVGYVVFLLISTIFSSLDGLAGVNGE